MTSICTTWSPKHNLQAVVFRNTSFVVPLVQLSRRKITRHRSVSLSRAVQHATCRHAHAVSIHQTAPTLHLPGDSYSPHVSATYSAPPAWHWYWAGPGSGSSLFFPFLFFSCFLFWNLNNLNFEICSDFEFEQILILNKNRIWTKIWTNFKFIQIWNLFKSEIVQIKKLFKQKNVQT
jgi:hypothetical protein